QGEGWGLCVLEAAACGVQTVAYDVEGLRDAVRDGQTGWLVRDGETLADVVDRALKELATPARRATIAQACRQWAAQFDWAASTTRMTTLIDACVTAGTSRGPGPPARGPPPPHKPSPPGPPPRPGRGGGAPARAGGEAGGSSPAAVIGVPAARPASPRSQEPQQTQEAERPDGPQWPQGPQGTPGGWNVRLLGFC